MTKAVVEMPSASHDPRKVRVDEASGTPDSVPLRRAVLDAIDEHEETARGIDVGDLDPLSQVVVKTRNTRYTLTVLNPADRKVIIQGGNFFGVPTEVQVEGSSFGGDALGSIALGMPLATVTDRGLIVTSRVESIEVFDHEGQIQRRLV